MTDIITSLTNFSRLRAGAESLAAQANRSSRIMWMLGPFIFSRDTAAPRTLRRSTEFKWPAHERMGRKPALQFTGQGSDTIDLDGAIYPHYKGGIAQVAAMRELAGLGLPQLLIDGRGMVYGKWVIERVEETGTAYLDNGTPRKIEFKVNLRCYGDDTTDGSNKIGILKW